MADVHESTRPRKRWGRRLLITFLVLLAILAAAFVVADRVAASYAEKEIGDRVARQVSDRGATSEKPDVTVAGVPFLTQVLAGEYQEIKILLKNYSGPAGNGKTVKMPELDIRAKDVTAPLDTIRSGKGDIVAGTVTGTGTIGYADLAELIGREGITISEKDGKLVGSAPVEALGQTFNVSGTATLEVRDGVVQVRFTDVTAQGLPDVPLVRNLIDDYAKNLALDLKVPALPMGLQVQKVEPRSEGLVVTTGASDVPLSSGGL
ncbi:LmeA family phospholipid-binding protein [Couchioplanes caeruleus]|uniref:DUF2993 family protein n=2 Tax=Couchioplanes caeruleus TaxID=56438 RepID=A0A1K0FAX3_9ACTN|nr:DUF2993 domain-containing protein [Couchioplanes caeruleus]OJF09993.1 hypothetical protein BG844_34445 [Couchioplanes caeruleus subsp. caeruleus]ROP31673.1 DUF2993 family protein [Couchioplanes caeruleus]